MQASMGYASVGTITTNIFGVILQPNRLYAWKTQDFIIVIIKGLNTNE